MRNYIHKDHPFGMQMPGRNFSSDEYRYGFNGYEKDDEIKGEGNSIDFGARIYDGRIGRFLSLDKYSSEYPGESNYIFAGNSPIYLVDINGDFKWPSGEQGEKLAAKYPHMHKYITERDPSKPSIQTMGKNEIIQQALIKHSFHANQEMIPKDNHPASAFGDGDFSDSKYELTPEIIEQAFKPGEGPVINIVDAPGGRKDAGGFNQGTDGTDYSSEIQINSKLFDVAESALSEGKDERQVQAAMLRVVSTIVHEYAEDFSSDNFINPETGETMGINAAQREIYQSYQPGYKDSGEGFEATKSLRKFEKGTSERALIPEAPVKE